MGEGDSVAVGDGVKVGVVVGTGDGNGIGDGVGVAGEGVGDAMSTNVIVGVGVGSEAELLESDVLVTIGVTIFSAVTFSLTAVGGLRELSLELSLMVSRYPKIAYVVTATAPKANNMARSVDVKNSTSLPGKYRRPETQTQQVYHTTLQMRKIWNCRTVALSARGIAMRETYQIGGGARGVALSWKLCYNTPHCQVREEIGGTWKQPILSP